MLDGRVIQHKVHHDPDPHGVGFVQQLPEIVHGTIGGFNILIVRNVVAVINLRGSIDGVEPDTVDSKFFQHIQLRNNALQITNTISIGIAKALAVDMIYDRFLPPLFLLLFTPRTLKRQTVG